MSPDNFRLPRYIGSVLSLILPTYNEAENVRRLLPRLRTILADVPFEVIVVDDDSPDRTWEVVREFEASDPRFRVIRRVGRRGLSSAVVEGFAAARGEVLAVADADGQHDLTLLPRLYAEVSRHGGIAVGSRYVAGGGVGNWDGRRQLLSKTATALASRLCRVRVSDPMSGYFALSRATFDSVKAALRPRGFKILLDILLRVDAKTRAVELPYVFSERMAGKSKLSLRVQWQFLSTLLEALLGRWLPRVFVALCVILAAWFAVRVWQLRLLYTDAHVRDEVSATVRAVAGRKGWLLSDIDLRSVDASGIRFVHREHLRNAPAATCFRASFASPDPVPCAG